MINALLACVLGYAFGSVPFGLIITNAAGLGDVRKIGSGNIGATNVLRTGNKKLALFTLIADALKGTIPVLIAAHVWGMNTDIAAAFGAMAGHIFPIWLKFKGGKGVATFIGVLFGLYWPLGVLFLGAWLLTDLLFRYSSLAALVATLLQPVLAMIFGIERLVLPLIILVIVIWFMHRANIMRLLTHKESKISFAKKS